MTFHLYSYVLVYLFAHNPLPFMKTLYQCFTLLLALGCWQTSLANGDDDNAPPPPVAIDITTTNTELGGQVCRNDPFTARATVSNTNTSGLTFQWRVAIGRVNGTLGAVRTSSNTVTCTVERPNSGDEANVILNVFRGNVMVGNGASEIVRVLPETRPGSLGSISVSADPPSPADRAPCQFAGVSFSVAPAPEAFAYVWTVGGRTSTTRNPSFFTSFSNTGSQTVTVRARGCIGDSPTQSTTVSVIARNSPPCNEGPFFQVSEAVSTTPNPVSTVFTLETPKSYISATAQLTDQKTGKVVQTFAVTGTETEVNTQGLPSGVYLLTVPGKEGKVTKRIIVQ